jgi:hypothetical protein
MKLEFVYTPVAKLDEALAFYRDDLGLSEAWREGDTTVALNFPESDVKLMLDADPSARPGPMFVVASVEDFRRDHPRLSYDAEAFEIPDGWMTSFSDPWGNVVYLMDQSGADDS